jgi:DNA mismatch endonuclease (patch repair protein)
MNIAEPTWVRPGVEFAARMSSLRRKDTRPEVELRRELHRRGCRFRLQVKVPGNNRRTIDIAFTRAKLAVLVDGCFWHSCPEHGLLPKTNRDWWVWKINRNQDRDADTDRLLCAAGWEVIRVWEHETVELAADQIVDLWARRISRPHGNDVNLGSPGQVSDE